MTKFYLVCNNKFKESSARSFHRFPKNIEPKKKVVLCSDHFSPESIRNLPAGKKSLVDRAIPIAVSVLHPINIERNKSTIESVPDKNISFDEISLNPSIALEIEK
ncbi:hypothetical protein JTB14_007147 [Gonioctena quinquepunctata]|nr:hypothetical protein JTB14_007147 [Gonioctena quinquepunctata]